MESAYRDQNYRIILCSLPFQVFANISHQSSIDEKCPVAKVRLRSTPPTLLRWRASILDTHVCCISGYNHWLRFTTTCAAAKYQFRLKHTSTLKYELTFVFFFMQTTTGIYKKPLKICEETVMSLKQVSGWFARPHISYLTKARLKKHNGVKFTSCYPFAPWSRLGFFWFLFVWMVESSFVAQKVWRRWWSLICSTEIWIAPLMQTVWRSLCFIGISALILTANMVKSK